MNVTIKTPCHESWNEMTISASGKFCDSCGKQVHDFEHSSPDDIRRAFAENDGKLCGRIPVKVLQDQYVEAQMRRIHSSYIKRFFFAALFCFGASLFTIDSAKASTLYKLKLSFQRVTTTTDSVIVSGVVKDVDGKQPVAFVSVVALKDGEVVGKATTDMNGRYSMKLSAGNTKVDVRARYIGYHDKIKEGVVLSSGKQNIVNIKFDKTEVIMMGDVDINYQSE